jgi:hypothetical protein
MSFAFLNLKPPVRVSSQTSSHEPTLSPSFVVVRIKEILSPEKYYGILRNFYIRRYLWYCEHVGFPIQQTFEKNTATQMSYGDVIVLEEVLDYGRVYQKTTNYFNHKGFLVYEQYFHSDSGLWRNTVISPSRMEEYATAVGSCDFYLDATVPLYCLQKLRNEDSDLYAGFIADLELYKTYLLDTVLLNLPAEKRERIRAGCSELGSLTALLWKELLDYSERLSYS